MFSILAIIGIIIILTTGGYFLLKPSICPGCGKKMSFYEFDFERDCIVWKCDGCGMEWW